MGDKSPWPTLEKKNQKFKYKLDYLSIIKEILDFNFIIMSSYIESLRSKDLSDVIINESIRKEQMSKIFEENICISKLSKTYNIPQRTIRDTKKKYLNGESLDYTMGRGTKIDKIGGKFL